jgi:PAS domain S-box-containing protein
LTGRSLLQRAFHFNSHETADDPAALRAPLHRRLVPYGIAGLLTVAATAMTRYLQSAIGSVTVILLIPAVILSSARWGAGVGAFSSLLAGAGIAFTMEPAGSLAVAGFGDRILLAAFIVVAAISTFIASRQRRLERQLRANEAEFRAIFDLAAVGTGMVDSETGRFLRVNEQLCKMTGFSREELLAKTVTDITHPDDRPRDRELLQPLMAGQGDRWSVEKRYLRRDGEVVWVLVNGTIVRGIGQEGTHFVAHAADITDRRRTDDALREASRLKDEFLATLSHELRTPLNVVAGWVRILRSDPACQDPMERGLAVIERNTDALRRLTDDLIGMSSVLTGRVRLDRRIVDLRSVLDDVVESIGLAVQAKGLVIRTHFENGLVVRGDEARLRQVFWNLISNALKFTPGGGTITTTARVEEDFIRVRVSDTGIGIPAAFLPHVFDKFRQEDASHTREHQGLGLGLTIARQFTELHGGTITVESRGRNEGAAFTVTLPVASPLGETADSTGTFPPVAAASHRQEER